MQNARPCGRVRSKYKNELAANEKNVGCCFKQRQRISTPSKYSSREYLYDELERDDPIHTRLTQSFSRLTAAFVRSSFIMPSLIRSHHSRNYGLVFCSHTAMLCPTYVISTLLHTFLTAQQNVVRVTYSGHTRSLRCSAYRWHLMYSQIHWTVDHCIHVTTREPRQYRYEWQSQK